MSSYIYIFFLKKMINYICCYKNTIIKKCNQCAIFYSFTTSLKVFLTTKAFLCIVCTEILNKSNFVYKNSAMTVAYKEFLAWLESLLPVLAAHHKGKTKTL